MTKAFADFQRSSETLAGQLQALASVAGGELRFVSCEAQVSGDLPNLQLLDLGRASGAHQSLLLPDFCPRRLRIDHERKHRLRRPLRRNPPQAR
jgi:hypothetical protein